MSILSRPSRSMFRRRTLGAAAVAIVLATGVAAPAGAQSEPGVEATRYGPFATASEFVEQQYRDLLRRTPGAEEVAFQAGRLEAGRAPEDLIVEFVESAEANSNIKAVVRLYRAYFLRNPDHQGLSHWIQRRQQGIKLSDVSNQFAASPEFAIRYGFLDDEEFIELVYENVMDRSPDAKGRAYWLERLSVGLYRGQLMTSFSDSREYVKNNQGAANAVTIYDGMYQSSIPRGIFDYLGPSLQSGRTQLDELARSYLDDPKYANRFR